MKTLLKFELPLAPKSYSAEAIALCAHTMSASGYQFFTQPRIVSVYSAEGHLQGYVAFPTDRSPQAKAYRRQICALFPNVRTYLAKGMERYRRKPSEPHVATMSVDSRISYGITAEKKMRLCHFVPQSFRYDKAIAVEMEGFSTHSHDTLAANLPYWSRVVSDGSIRPNHSEEKPAEVKAVFPRSMLEPRLYRIAAKLKTLGLKCNKSCGLHVHFDMRGRTSADVLKIAKRVDKWLRALQELVPASRRDQNYCKFGISTTGSDRYRAVNFASFSKYQTLEIRLHSATFDYAKILSWIRLCELLIALRSNPKDADCIGTLGQLPLMDYELSYWKARHRALNPTQYTNQDGATTEQSE